MGKVSQWGDSKAGSRVGECDELKQGRIDRYLQYRAEGGEVQAGF